MFDVRDRSSALPKPDGPGCLVHRGETTLLHPRRLPQCSRSATSSMLNVPDRTVAVPRRHSRCAPFPIVSTLVPRPPPFNLAVSRRMSAIELSPPPKGCSCSSASRRTSTWAVKPMVSSAMTYPCESELSLQATCSEEYAGLCLVVPIPESWLLFGLRPRISDSLARCRPTVTAHVPKHHEGLGVGRLQGFSPLTSS